jgi:Uma2 family endonuclease
MVQARQRLTLEEFLRLPEAKPALEYADGEVTQKVSPKLRHGASQTAFVTLVNAVGIPKRLAFAAVETRCTFGGRSHVPDVAVFSWERIPVDADGEMLDDVSCPPDIAVEVVSPGQSMAAQANRCRWYVANGVRVSLLLDPRARLGRSVRVFRLDGETGPLRGAERVDLGDVIPGFSFVVDEPFAVLRAR